MGPHGIPRGCQLSSQSCNGGSLQAQLSDRPPDRPHTQARPGCAHPLVMFQECRRLAGVFAAYPASFVPSDPRRDPGPGRVDHLHHHATMALSDSAHNPGIQPAGCTTQQRVPEHLGCEPRSSDGSPPPPEVLDDSGGRSPLIIKDLDLYPQPRPTPGHPHSTLKSPFNPTSSPSSEKRPQLYHIQSQCTRQSFQPLHLDHGKTFPQESIL